MKQPKSIYVCSNCSAKYPKWMGRCTSCGEYNTVSEVQTQPTSASRASAITPTKATRFTELKMPTYMRIKTGMRELDRVLGGGIVDSSAVLITGEPGIGKSTLLTQISGVLSKDKKVLYVSGEESTAQLKFRADRLGVDGEDLFILTETNVDRVIDECKEVSCDYVIVDSIQTMYTEEYTSTAGSITQVRECTMRLINYAKCSGVCVIIVGHVNKEGSIAGPKVLEHMVDAVLNFEGDRQQIFRIIRASKNRYGSTNEIGVFEMTEKGLMEVANPSEMLLAGRPSDISGNCAVCVMEGTRPLITEIQALTATTVFSAPKRASNGLDYNKLHLMLAVLEKRLGLKLSTLDTFVNVVGGIRLDDPSFDLPLALAIISSVKDISVPDDLIAFGEIGLAGECRSAASVEMRINEASKLGFTKVVLPQSNYSKLKSNKQLIDGIAYYPIKSIFDALTVFSSKKS